MEAEGFRTVPEGSKTNAVADTGVGGELGVKKSDTDKGNVCVKASR